MDDSQLGAFVSGQTERSILRLLHSLAEPELKLRLIQCVSDEATLKRISRSELDKKLKRAAERKLRETGGAAAELKLQRVSELGNEIQLFLRVPRWDHVQDLLDQAFDSKLADAVSTEFQSLRARLRREADEYEETMTEMEALCQKPAPSRSTPRWNDLAAKYKTQRSRALQQRYAARELEAKPAPIQIRTAEKPKPAEKPQPQAESPEKNEQRRKNRLEGVERLLRDLREAGQHLSHRRAGPRLRELQKEATLLARWRKEYPAQLDEAETLLKTLAAQRTQAVEETKWATWARTDLANRIQKELEEIITDLEAESDLEAALRKSSGLMPRLAENAKEMRDLGSLERGKDHKIWKQFKALSDRGALICDKLRQHAFDQLKSTLTEHASKPLDLTVAALSGPHAQLALKTRAFEPEIAARFKALFTHWRDLGVRTSKPNPEIETVGSKLFELYFRQHNLHFGRIQRTDANAAQKKRELLNEMKIACEGKSTLLSRMKVANSLEQRWKSSPLPEAVASQFQAEFEGYRQRLDTEIKDEVEKHVILATGIQTQAQAVLDQVRAKNGVNLGHALKTVFTLETELQAMQKHLAQFPGVQHETSRFEELRGQIGAVFQACRAAAEQETSERTGERDRVIREACALAMSPERESLRPRFEELRLQWKKVGVLGQRNDARFELLFENIWKFYLASLDARTQPLNAEQRAKALKTRDELLCSLDALTRLQKSVAPLPFSEKESSKAAGQVLQLGMKYRQILALDPEGGVIKETKKIMEQWAKLKLVDEDLPKRFWDYYLDRARLLLGIAS
jgi:hypothetical protein